VEFEVGMGKLSKNVPRGTLWKTIDGCIAGNFLENVPRGTLWKSPGKLLPESTQPNIVPRGTLWKTQVLMLTVLVSVGVISHWAGENHIKPEDIGRFQVVTYHWAGSGAL
jgi:hypothetical protein